MKCTFHIKQYLAVDHNLLYYVPIYYYTFFVHHFKTGSRRLKLFFVCAIPATLWSLRFYLSESVKICLLPLLMKVLVLNVCWMCDWVWFWMKIICHIKQYVAVNHNLLYYVPIYYSTFFVLLVFIYHTLLKFAYKSGLATRSALLFFSFVRGIRLSLFL